MSFEPSPFGTNLSQCRGPNPSEPGVDATTGNAMVPSCCCDCEQAATEFGRNRDAGAEAEGGVKPVVLQDKANSPHGSLAHPININNR